MRQPGIEIRPIVQITGTSEFSEVFFDGARTARRQRRRRRERRAGGWRWARSPFERGASTLGQQLGFESELDARHRARHARTAPPTIPSMRQRLADAWIGLRIMRFNALRTLSATRGRRRPAARRRSPSSTGPRGTAASASSRWTCSAPRRARRRLDPYELTLQRIFLFTRADTIYAGSNQIQRNIIAERALGLPREPRPEPDMSAQDSAAPVRATACSRANGARHRRRRHRHRLRDRASAAPRRAPSSSSATSHERRLGEAADELEPLMGRGPPAVLCDVTDEAEVQRLFDAAIAASRPPRRARQQRRPRRHGRTSST